MRQIFLDTETTGLYCDRGDRIIEIGCVEMVNRKLTGKNLHVYVNPGRDSHEEALKVHGISNEFLRDKPQFSSVADMVLEFLADAEIVIHNADFDVGFLNAELGLVGRPLLTEHVCGVVDTLAMAKEMFPGKRNNLDALCERLGVDNSGRTLHGALLDAELLAEVYINMTRGQNALSIESDIPGNEGVTAEPLDLSSFDLPVLVANPRELALHQQVLSQIQKPGSGAVAW
jgi:DNA polymerase-3 subunit epsilon